MRDYGFGVDIGGTTVKIALFKADGELEEKWEIPTRTEDGGRHIVSDIAKSVLSCMERRGALPERFLGIGVGVPGPVAGDGSASAVNLGWHGEHVAERLLELTGLPARVENDANIAALGEQWMGRGRGAASLVMVTLGTGVGGGIIVNGRILSGAHSAGGEIGHIPVEPSETRPCNCGNCGCLEQYASANGCVRLARDILSSSCKESALRAAPELNSKVIWERALGGDELAGEIVDRFCWYLGRGLATVADVVDPEIILLGGGVSRVGEPLVERVTAVFRKSAFPACRNTPIAVAVLGNDAGIYGAMRLLLVD